MLTQDMFQVLSLGDRCVDSPLLTKGQVQFVNEAIRVLLKTEVDPQAERGDVLSFEEAGPRKKIFFDPAATTAAIVTCGGLSPGLNNVIRSVFLELTYRYGVRRVLGLRNGYAGLNPASGLPPIVMDAAFVDEIHDRGGTVLGTSRGPQDPRITVDFMEQERIDIVFCLGGDGTQRGAHAMHEEAQRRGLKKAIVGIPKTIDNDVPYVRSTFGYATALEKAETVLRGAHVEARSAPNGIAIVKLMGRAAGFIAAGAALASQEANFVLVPEVAFPLDGENGLLTTLERRILARRHALIVVAEGAGQHLFTNQASERDASGNVKFQDIGPFLKDRITEYFASRGIPINLKYLDPSYFIRSVPANAFDRILSDQMGRHAVHAAMAGKTDLIIGSWAGSLTHVPISTVVADKKRMDVHGDLWNSVMATTGQPWW